MTARSWTGTEWTGTKWAESNHSAIRNRPVTDACCPDCRLRFDILTAARLPACPNCGSGLRAVPALESVVGFRLFKPQDLQPTSAPEALAVALPIPGPWVGR